eukprot:c25145_g1_i1 orf=340-945(+)
MRILCDACEAAPSRFFCAADEAALCVNCDEKVHGCNKLASRHMRLVLAEVLAPPQCDICECAPAFFFCEIDGTSLCLQCDMNAHVGGKKTHRRFLLIRHKVETPMRIDEADVGGKSRTDRSTRHVKESYQQHHYLHEDLRPPVQFVTSRMMDTESKPLHLHGEIPHVNQTVRDVELDNGSDNDSPGMVPDLSVKGKRLANC